MTQILTKEQFAHALADRQQRGVDLQVPAKALRMPVAFQLAADQGTSTDGVTSYPFKMLARSTEPVLDWYFGAIYHDFSGMERRETIPVDYCHYDTEVIGAGSKFPVDKDGLHIVGHLVSTRTDDRTDEIVKKARAGVPWEASIDFRSGVTLLEEIPEGYTATVNGGTVQGPCLIVRKWKLRGVAVCPYGMDENTESKFSQDTPSGTVRILTARSDMAEPTPAPAPEQPAAPEKPQAPEVKPEAKPEAPATEGTPTEASQFKSQLKKFQTRFGAQAGAEYLAADLTYEAALEKHCDHLASQLAAVTEKAGKLQARIDSAQLGEKTPATTGEDDAEPRSGGMMSLFKVKAN